MKIPCFTRIYNSMRHELMKSGEKMKPCNIENEGSAKLFIAYVEVFSDKRAAT